MKKRDLIDALSSAAAERDLEFVLKRQGSNHEVWSLDGMPLAVPRHREIAEGTARSIRKQAGEKLGEGWSN